MSAVLTPIRLETGFWLILIIGLGSGIGIESDWGRQMQSRVSETVATSTQFSMPALTEPFQLPAPEEFLDITARPLFVVTRRPAPASPPPEPPKPSMQKGQFVLTGTIVVAEGKFAFLLEKAGNKRWSVAEGKQINGIMVKEVTKERVVLSQYDDTEVLVLKANPTPPVPPATGSVAPVPPAAGRAAPVPPAAGRAAPVPPAAGGITPKAPPGAAPSTPPSPPGAAPGPMPSSPGGGIGLRPRPGTQQ